MFASFWLGLAIFGIFEMGNCFTDPFGDDPADLGAYISQGGETYVCGWVGSTCRCGWVVHGAAASGWYGCRGPRLVRLQATS